jgi:hypothetical protein
MQVKEGGARYCHFRVFVGLGCSGVIESWSNFFEILCALSVANFLICPGIMSGVTGREGMYDMGKLWSAGYVYEQRYEKWLLEWPL